MIIALPGKVAGKVIKSLNFPSGLQVVSLVASIKLAELQAITNSKNAAIAVPLPAIAHQQGATLGIPPSPIAEAIFSPLGSYTAVSDQEQFTRMQSASCFMGGFYKKQLAIQQWTKLLAGSSHTVLTRTKLLLTSGLCLPLLLPIARLLALVRLR